MINRVETAKRMSKLMAPVDQQILMCDDRQELLMMACAMMQRTHEIFLQEVGEKGAKIMYKDYV